MLDKLFEKMKTYIYSASDEELEQHFEWYNVDRNDKEDLLYTMWESYVNSYEDKELEERIEDLFRY